MPESVQNGDLDPFAVAILAHWAGWCMDHNKVASRQKVNIDSGELDVVPLWTIPRTRPLDVLDITTLRDRLRSLCATRIGIDRLHPGKSFVGDIGWIVVVGFVVHLARMMPLFGVQHSSYRLGRDLKLLAELSSGHQTIVFGEHSSL